MRRPHPIVGMTIRSWIAMPLAIPFFIAWAIVTAADIVMKNMWKLLWLFITWGRP